MTKEELKETIIDYVIDTYSLNKDRDVVANHVDEWLDCRQQVNSVDLADVGETCVHPWDSITRDGSSICTCDDCGKSFQY